MSPKFNELVAKLREIFEIDKPELDFGIYRILHSRAKKIDDFLLNRLSAKVKDALTSGSTAQKKQLQDELDAAVEAAKTLGADPDSLPKVRELKAKLQAFAGEDDAETQVYAHLLTFFSRYYEDGDFISKRRYKEGVYAIPYSGEEVKLHWANADQYYIKSGESFTNYSFTLDGGKKVHFKLVAAETAKDNIKDNEAVRCFVLWNPREAVPDDASGDEDSPERPAQILEVKNGELYVYFQYRKFKKGTKQKSLLDEALKIVSEKLLADGLNDTFPLLSKAPTEKDKNRTILEKHLTAYTAKNTSDYFIHKDLKGFLTRELDFYIKNEMMHLDDIQSATSFKNIELNLRQIQAVRTIALELIDFMAQIEDFQKKLWLKKKFVTSCNYCITMDRIPAELRAEVLANKDQLEEWKRLGTDKGPEMGGDLLLHLDGNAIDARMVDTKFFSEEFKAKLLEAIPDIDNHCDGLLIHSENFQAIGLLRKRFLKQIDYIYIDPPYNSKTSRILYKNNYLHSSWLSLLNDRLMRSQCLLDGPLTVAIDENEQEHLGIILSQWYPSHNKVCVCVVHNKKGIQGDYFSTCHEYAYFLIPNDFDSFHGKKIHKVDWEYSNLRKWGSDSDRSTAKNCFYPIYVKNGDIIGYGPVCGTDEHPSAPNIIQADGSIAVYPIESASGAEKKWRYARDTIETIAYLLKVVVTRSGEVQIHKAVDEAPIKTLWSESRYIAGDYGTKWLSDLHIKVSDNLFPKSLFTIVDSVMSCANKNSLILDFFGGSGTTAHAIVYANREDGGNRKYILVEMGDHFDTVLKPRIQKVVYSPEWKDGKPTAADKGISHCFKYLTLESYEDALNNIELTEPQEGLSLTSLQDEYFLKYMLDIEAKGSVISTDDFKHPFDYKLKIAVDSSGASAPRVVDLPETFKYLIGLKVAGETRKIADGFLYMDGTLPNHDKAFVLWRDVEKVPNEALDGLLKKLGVNPAEKEYDVIYVNGDHAIANMTVNAEGEEKQLKVRQIENVFLAEMFAED
ncbi:MAG: DNA methyltransferase [Kiritimatiellia bacterium]